MHFRDRAEAGRLLAQALKKYQKQDGVVYALPRGGVVLAAGDDVTTIVDLVPDRRGSGLQIGDQVPVRAPLGASIAAFIGFWAVQPGDTDVFFLSQATAISLWMLAMGAAVLVFFLLSGYGPTYQSGWWDIHVSPPHNIRATNAKKVLFAHMPFLLIALTHFTLFGNALVFAGFHAIALACSAVAMRFPPFWEQDGPVVNRETAIGV